MTAGRQDRSFPKACRLTSSDEFRRVYRNAWRGRSGPFTWHARPNSYRRPRLGMTVPKRVIKRATGRSRIKRLIRESFRHNRSELPSVDIIVSVKSPPRDLYDPSLHGLIENMWKDVQSSAAHSARS